MDNHEAIDDVLLRLNGQLTVFQKEELRNDLIAFINHLLLHDFNRLLQILYRVDVDEQKLKMLLKQNLQTDAAVLITDLLIQRQEEKLKAKQSFNSGNTIPENEKW